MVTRLIDECELVRLVVLCVGIIVLSVVVMGISYIIMSKPVKEKIAVPLLTAENATQILLENVIKPGELNHDLVALLWPQMLKAGDNISSHGAPEHVYTIEENTWFFWINDFPYAMFSHPTRYVFINALTGEYEIKIESWWPQLNRTDLWGSSEEYWNKQYWVYSTYIENHSTVMASFVRTPNLTGSGNNSTSRNRALIIEGEPGFNQDIPTSAGEWHYLMENVFGFDVTHLELWGDEENRPTENNIENVMESLSKLLKPCENFSIYITGHGRENDGAIEMVDGFMLTPEKFSKWVCKFENGVHISVTVAACYSGKWIEALKKWDKKVEIIYTSTDNDSMGWGDLDHKNTTFGKYREAVENGDASPDLNPDDMGLEAVSGLVEDMEALAENFKKGDISWAKLWQEAIKSAKEKDAALQNQEFFKKWTETNLPNQYPPCSGKGVENPQEWISSRVKDNITPSVVSTHPENGEENVPVSTSITVTFSERMSKTATQSAFSVFPEVDGEFSWSENTLIFTPTENLMPETVYGVTIGEEAMDLAWNSIGENYIWYFFTIASL